MYDAVTRCFLYLMQSSATDGWNGTGNKLCSWRISSVHTRSNGRWATYLMTRSDSCIMLSTFFESRMSRSMALAFACGIANRSASVIVSLATECEIQNSDCVQAKTISASKDEPMISWTSVLLHSSSTVGFDTKPLPKRRTFFFRIPAMVLDVSLELNCVPAECWDALVTLWLALHVLKGFSSHSWGALSIPSLATVALRKARRWLSTSSVSGAPGSSRYLPIRTFKYGIRALEKCCEASKGRAVGSMSTDIMVIEGRCAGRVAGRVLKKGVVSVDAFGRNCRPP